MRKYTCADCGRERYAGIRCACGSEDLTLDYEHFESMLARRAPDTDVECGACGADLEDEDVQAYQHSGGWTYGGEGLPLPRMRFWLSIKCPHCTYETSFDKFGIKR
jgi:DNA-directed RNA polymerase subunit RPC12/RpoP